MNNICSELNKAYREVYKHNEFIPLHAPIFQGNEKDYLLDCIDSTFVSSVGKYVDEFQKKIEEYIDIKYAVATVNGTSALHLAILSCDIGFGDEVICPDISFVATASAIAYSGADPVFLDIDEKTLGLSALEMQKFIIEHTYEKDSYRYNKQTHKKVKACIVMHNIGFPADIEKIQKICEEYNIILIEDAAEALGSSINEKMCGTFGQVGIFSFNGNKILTTGGGGMLVTDDENIYQKALHLSTTAKIPHPYLYNHDEVGYNYRMPNLNAALGVAQLEHIEGFLQIKKEQHNLLELLIKKSNSIEIITPKYGEANYWFVIGKLNGMDKDEFIEQMKTHRIMCRPLWSRISQMKPYQKYISFENLISQKIEESYVCLPNGISYVPKDK
jgi:aminotransferase in exopolysaccharide biosynthesis